MSAEHVILILERVLSDSKGPMTNALRAQLANVDPETGRFKVEGLLEAAEKEALKPTANGRKIAKLLPATRLLAAEIRSQKGS